MRNAVVDKIDFFFMCYLFYNYGILECDSKYADKEDGKRIHKHYPFNYSNKHICIYLNVTFHFTIFSISITFAKYF